MEIVYKKIDELKPYENNPRFNDDAVEYVAKSIKEFGFKVPIVLDKNNVIVAGHTRYKASMELGLDEVPCIIADDLTEEQVKAFRLADNKVSEQASWNFDLLEDELEDILEIDMEQFDFKILDEEILQINDEGLENAKSKYEHIMTIDKITIPITEEEYEKFMKIYNNYLKENGVNFGILNSILE